MYETILAPIDRVGQRAIQEARFVRDIFALLYLTLKHFWLTSTAHFSRRRRGVFTIFRVLVTQIYFTGVQCLPIITMLGLMIGSVIVLQTVTQLSRFGGINQIGELIVLMIIRDVGPLLTTLVIIARSGTAIASEISTMKVNREIDALVAMGISPLNYIVIPRVLGGTISVIAINIWFSTIGVLGGFVLSAFLLNIQWEFFSDRIMSALTATDLSFFLIKSAVGGAAIFLIACMQGFEAKRASFEVPIVTIGSVVKSLTFCLAFHGVATASFYMFTSPAARALVTEFFTWN